MIVVVSIAAYTLIAANYRETLGPALETPDGRAGLGRALRSVLAAIAAVDGALLLLVGASSYALARAAVRPLVAAREREARFAADVAHELRTPLSVIAGVAQASEGTAAGEQQAAFATIATHALDAGQLVGDLLTLARRDDAEALVCEPIDLAQIASRAVADSAALAARRNIRINSTLTSTIVDGDARRIRQLVNNLLDNALRYAVREVDVNVDGTGAYGRLVVVDDGPGVPDGLRGPIFDRFTKGTESTGSGLGLAICRWIANAHGGDITLEDRSRFVLRIPIVHH